MSKVAYNSEGYMHILSLKIEGPPVASSRPRVAKNGGVWDTKAKQKKEIIRCLKQQLEVEGIVDCGLRVNLYFYFSLPKYLQKKSKDSLIYHTKKPDLDNLSKTYLDALTGLVWKDDAQVVHLNVWKGYGEHARTEIEIERMDYGRFRA